MLRQLVACYLDNELWHCDSVGEVFHGATSQNTGVTQTFEEVAGKGAHVSSFQIVLIKGYPYYHEERLRELRRVGNGAFILSYEQFDLLPEKDRKLGIPEGAALKAALVKEKAYWLRKERRAEADDDSERGQS